MSYLSKVWSGYWHGVVKGSSAINSQFSMDRSDHRMESMHPEPICRVATEIDSSRHTMDDNLGRPASHHLRGEHRPCSTSCMVFTDVYVCLTIHGYLGDTYLCRYASIGLASNTIYRTAYDHVGAQHGHKWFGLSHQSYFQPRKASTMGTSSLDVMGGGNLSPWIEPTIISLLIQNLKHLAIQEAAE